MLTAVLANAAGDAVNGAVGWSTDNDRVATVDQQGRITAGIAGEATITATAGCKASATVGVTVGALTADPEEFLLAIGESVTVAVRDASGNALPPAAIQWTSSHENVATVDSNGAVMARNLGAATLTGRVRATGAIATSHVTTFVNLPDAALNAAVRSALGIAPLQLITLEIADRLGRLEAPGRGIVSLTGIQYFPKLEYLFLERNGIADLAVLATMGQLRSLSVRRNPLSNILPLVGLRNLTGLDISETNVADISPLAQMTQLTLLQIDKLGLSRLDTIAWLRALEWLDFGSNAVKDLTPLAGLTELRVLQGPANHVSDISPLASLRKLDSLVLSVNRIADISALANLTQLTFVNLIRNDIASVAPLAGLTRLRFLSLEENRITDIEPLVANPGIGAGDIISLAKNYLTDGFHVRPKPRANPLQVDSCGGDTTDCDDFAALLDRGVRVTGQWPAFQNEVQCFKGEPRLVKKGDQVCRLPRP